MPAHYEFMHDDQDGTIDPESTYADMVTVEEKLEELIVNLEEIVELCGRLVDADVLIAACNELITECERQLEVVREWMRDYGKT